MRVADLSEEHLNRILSNLAARILLVLDSRPGIGHTSVEIEGMLWKIVEGIFVYKDRWHLLALLFNNKRYFNIHKQGNEELKLYPW